NHDRYSCPHGVYPTAGADRWCALSIHDDAEWVAFKKALEEPEWTKSPALMTEAGRRAAAPELDRGIAEWTAARSREEVVRTLRAAAIHVAPVNDMADLHSDPQLNARQVFRPLAHGALGSYMGVGPPFALSETPANLSHGAPLLGEHTRQVMRDMLGISDDECERLEREHAFD
ncbi:MAG: CoA transferase, partial [Candidatus Dormibacteraceae bacterium]